MENPNQARTLYLQAQERKELENLGKTLTLAQFLDLLEMSPELGEGLRQRLNPLLVGLPSPVFFEALSVFSPEQLRTLCLVADDEPLQYHLTLIIHELSEQGIRHANEVTTIVNDINQYDIAKVTQSDLEGFRKRIHEARAYFLHALTTLDHALTLAWNTNRESIIDKLTILKENWIRYLSAELGHPGDETHMATGIYALFDTHFGAIYPLSALSDDDAAFDALAALSVWYIEDYWNLGLLPGIKAAEQLHLNPREHDEISQRLYRERLTTAARENLQALGLNTVGDLKQERLYSQRMLARFIQRRQGQLNLFRS